MRAVLLAVLVACAYADQDARHFAKTVKGGHNSYQYKGGDTTRFFGFNNTDYQSQHGYGQHPQVPAINFEVGVCYREVPTASLVRDPAHIPAGNGSRPDLSRIRTCCEGYKRNVYNFLICEPACSQECVNGLCSAPETCTCFPDHVKNLGGFCVATCPIGCQNGHCAGGECLCKEGFKLDVDGKFCVPTCRSDCGGLGNCTAPNTCECKPGYQNRNGGCEPQCNKDCGPNGRCTAPNVCGIALDTNQYPEQKHLYPPSPRPIPNDSHSRPTPNQTPNSFPQQNPTNPRSPYAPKDTTSFDTDQTEQYPRFPVYPITYNSTHPNQPLYPGSQVTTPSPSSYGHQPQYPSNQYPQVPNQYPQVPTNQFPGNFPSQYPTQTQNFSVPYPGNPQQPSNNYGGYPYSGRQVPNQPQQPQQPQQFSPYYPNPQRPDSTSYHGYPQPQPNQAQDFHPGQGTYGYSQVDQHTQVNQQTQVDQFEQSHVTGPICGDGCINGVCVAHNQCRCNPGYILDDDDPTGKRCGPYCPGGCPNGYCASPYSCACNEGYHKDTSVKGRALCIKRGRRSADLATLIKN